MNLVCAHCGLVYPLQDGLSLCPRCARTNTEELSPPKVDEIGHSFGLWGLFRTIAVLFALVFLAYIIYVFIVILGAASWAK